MKNASQGIMIGKAVGDALGFPVEGNDVETCQVYANKLSIHKKIPKRRSMTFGQYTDDTQLARELLISIRDSKGFSPNVYAKRIANLFSSNKIVGRGRATQNAALRLIEGKSWKESGEPSPSAGNGTAMRSGVISIVSNDNTEIKSIAKDSSVITHKDVRCVAGSTIMAIATHLLSKSERIDVPILVTKITQEIEIISPLFASEFEKLTSLLELGIDQASERISKLGEPDMAIEVWHNISPYVIPSVIWAFYAFLTNSESFPNTIKTAIKGGGDVDTTAAMAGALSGAFLGVDAIPKMWQNSITDKGSWECDDLKELVDTVEVMKNEGQIDQYKDR